MNPIFILLLILGPHFCLCQDLCSSEHGKFSLKDTNSILATVKNNKNVTTVFLDRKSTFDFVCQLYSGSDAQIEFGYDKENSTQFSNERTLEVSKLRNDKKGWNTKPQKVECFDVCKINVVIVKAKSTKLCNDSGSFRCAVEDLSDLELIVPRTSFFEPIDGFEGQVTYSIFDPVNGTWLSCEEIDDDGEIVKISTSSGEEETEEIDCPIDKSDGKARPVIIRVEEHEPKDRNCIAMPILCPKKEPEYSYISHQYKGHKNKVESETQNGNFVIISVVLGLILAIFAISMTIFCICTRKKKSPESSVFHADVEKSPYTLNDNTSLKTEATVTTSNNYKMRDFNFISDEDILGDLKYIDSTTEEGKKLRKQIISRQLSGDPTRFNPDLALNHQARVLSYNLENEIDRSNFEVGKMLGSGNFGCVYEGLAENIFYPGSKTKVAIKTVNDSLDQAQVQALLCEIKVLGSLELHLNLVNLLGNCKSQLLDRGDLYLLLEYCPHGDLKSFLLKHREEFLASVKNNLAISGLDERLFFKWAHSIAKGMEYLSSKKIMHGDLAARNILIGGLEGGPENYVAKVSDFGLSKTFYDNIGYKKQDRVYVPWKWMALEYLQDGCFTMNSDVWSYGVVVWEILSLGQEPYMGKDVESAINEIKSGARLACPDILGDQDWLEKFYAKVTQGCWKADPGDRYSFEQLVEILESELTMTEVMEHQELIKQYKTMRDLFIDDATRSKRSLRSSDPQNNAQNTEPREPLEAVPQLQPDGYLKFEAAVKEMSPSNGGGYITVTQAMS